MIPDTQQSEKVYDKSVAISARIYNGRYGKGGVFKRDAEFVLAGDKAKIKAVMELCVDPQVEGKACLAASVPFSMSAGEVAGLNQVLDTIANKFQSRERAEDTKSLARPEYFGYTDVCVNGANYPIKNDDEVLSELRGAIKYDLAGEPITKAYDTLVK